MAETPQQTVNLTAEQKEKILVKIRSDNVGRNSFKRFLASEYAEENLLFVEAVDEYEKCAPHELADCGNKIFQTFIDADSDKEINIPAPVMRPLRLHAKEGKEFTKGVFEGAYNAVRTNLKEDCLIRYIQSDFYAAFVKHLEAEAERYKKKSPNATPSPGLKKKGDKAKSTTQVTAGQGDAFDDIVSLMLNVYDEVLVAKEKMDHTDVLGHFEMDQQNDSGNAPCNVTDFELFLASGLSQGEINQKEKEKREKKEREKREKKERKEQAKAEKASDSLKRKEGKSDQLTKKSSKFSITSPFKKKSKGKDTKDSKSESLERKRSPISTEEILAEHDDATDKTGLDTEDQSSIGTPQLEKKKKSDDKEEAAEEED